MDLKHRTSSTREMGDSVATTYIDKETGENVQVTGDAADLAFFGKKQRLKRVFGQVSMIGFVACTMITWEGITLLLGAGLFNGGPLGLICNFIYSWVGIMAQTLVMAELGSMIPLAGGQYNWVSVIAPKSCSKFLSYMTGWMIMIGYQAGAASATWLWAVLIQVLISLSIPSYEIAHWQTFLMAYATILLLLLFNTVLARFLPKLEIAVFVFHIFGFVAILIALVTLSPHKSADFVFETFLDGGKWGSDGTAFFVGTTATLFAFVGADASAHLAEELENAAIAVPRSMLIASFLNGVMGLGMLIALMFCIGNFDKTLSFQPYPFLQIFHHATGSISGVIGLTVPFVVVLLFASVNVFMTSTRMLWAFARERGVPGHSWISKVDKRTALPINSILVVAVVDALANLLSFSDAAFNALTGVSVAGFFSTFILAASTMLYRRLTTDPASIRWGPFQLGRAAIPIYIYAIGFSIISWFFSFWPSFNHPTISEMNWSSVVYVGIILLSLLYWLIYARKVYTGPVLEMEIIEDRQSESKPTYEESR